MIDVELTDNSEEVLKDFDERVQTALELIGLKAEGYAKKDCPVDTGLLRNSINYRTRNEEKAVYIGTNVEYGKYVQFGTSKMKPRDFMLSPLRANLGHYKDIITKYLKQG